MPYKPKSWRRDSHHCQVLKTKNLQDSPSAQSAGTARKPWWRHVLSTRNRAVPFSALSGDLICPMVACAFIPPGEAVLLEVTGSMHRNDYLARHYPWGTVLSYSVFHSDVVQAFRPARH